MAKKSVRYWLTFLSKDIQRPLLWEMSHKHEVIYDIRSASVGPELGLVALELTGESKAYSTRSQGPAVPGGACAN